MFYGWRGLLSATGGIGAAWFAASMNGMHVRCRRNVRPVRANEERPIRLDSQQHATPPASRYNPALLPMLFAWPLVIAVGALLNAWTDSTAPMAALPMVWLLTLAWMIEREILNAEC